MSLKTQQGIVLFSPDILQGEKFQGLIKQITPDNITIIIPMGNIAIDSGIDIFVSFWDNHATYEFKTKSLSSKSITENILNIARPTTITKVLNRSFPRVVIKIAGKMLEEDSLKYHWCLIVDISGCGVLVTSKVNKKVNEMVKLSFLLPNGENFEDVTGMITWKKQVDEALFSYGIEFKFFSEIRRKKIIAFVDEEITNQKK